MTRTAPATPTTPIAGAANSDRSAAESVLRDIAFVLQMTRRAKSIDTSAMHDRTARVRTGRTVAIVA